MILMHPDDLVKCLRAPVFYSQSLHSTPPTALELEAANVIEDLRAEVARLERRLNDALAQAKANQCSWLPPTGRPAWRAMKPVPRTCAGRPCSSCGTSDELCLLGIQNSRAACCSTCSYTSTHDRAMP